jgi:hypothetical protein
MKNTHGKKGWGMVQVVEYLPSRSEALSLNHSTMKKLNLLQGLEDLPMMFKALG